MEQIKVLFVCLGNICRSPMAEGVFTHLVEEAGWSERFFIDSAGTSSHHAGELADRRMRETASGHGLTLTSRARQFVAADLDEFDYILPMDHSNLRNIESLIPPSGNHKGKIVLMRDFDPQPQDGNVPDPYYGGQDGFENVYRILLRSNQRLLSSIQEEQDL